MAFQDLQDMEHGIGFAPAGLAKDAYMKEVFIPEEKRVDLPVS